MNITTINAGSTKLFGADKKGPSGTGTPPADEKKAGKFDTFTMSGTERKKPDEAEKAPDAKQAELIHRLSSTSEEEKALAAIDAYHGLQKEFRGRIRSLEKTAEHFDNMQREYDFCKKTLENDCKAAYSGEFSFGRFKKDGNVNEEVLKHNMAQLERGMKLCAAAFDRNAGQTELNARIQSSQERTLNRLVNVYNAATGGGVSGIGEFDSGSCFDRYIDGINVDNFVSKLRERIGQYKEYSEDLTRSFSSYLDGSKTAENVFRRYPKIIAMRREFQDMHEKMHDYEKQIKDSLGINDMLDELKRLRKERRDDGDDKTTFISDGGYYE